MCGHLLWRCGAWPQGLVFEPCYQMEDAIEHFFSSVKCIKKDIKGSLTIANSIGSAHLLHSRQRRRLREAGVAITNQEYILLVSNQNNTRSNYVINVNRFHFKSF